MSGTVKHGKYNTRIYRCWSAMKSRCNSATHKCYPDYGGRGIEVCASWQEFIPFYTWSVSNGYADGLELDRIDNDGGYSPSNCRWVTHGVNQSNKRSFASTGIKGVYVPSNGKGYMVQVSRVYVGWFATVDEALEARQKFIVSGVRDKVFKTTTGFTGVYRRGSRFVAKISGKAYLGTFNTVEEAVAARKKYIEDNNLNT